MTRKKQSGASSADGSPTLFVFAEKVISDSRLLGRIRTSETYLSAIRSFHCYREGKDVALKDIDSHMILKYETFLRNRGLCPNSSSFYMRNLRAIYNRAVHENLTKQKFPFKHVYTGVDKTSKRAVSINTIRQIKDMDLSTKPNLDFARDIFMFSFYTRGMSFIDIAYLRKQNLSYDTLSYRRRKTGQMMSIRWEECMQAITDKYSPTHTPFLLPIIRATDEQEQRKQYINISQKVNRSLKIIGRMLNLHIPLTMYVSRHAWASITKNKNVPLAVISEGLGHDSEKTTRIYLASLDNVAVDNANSMILKLLS